MHNAISRLNGRQDQYAEQSVTLSYSHYDRFLALDHADRHIFKRLVGPNGEHYSVVQLEKGDEYAAWALSKIVQEEHPNSIKNRTIGDHQRLIGNDNRFNGSGSMMLGVVHEETGRLVGMAAYENMSDESDAGSGPEVYFAGKKDNDSQAYLKSLCILNEVSKLRFEENGKNFGLADVLTMARILLFIETGRDILVTKTNNCKLADKYESQEWVNKSRHPELVPQAALVFGEKKIEGDREIEVLMLTREAALSQIEANSTSLLMPKLVIVGHDHEDVRTVAKQVALTPVIH